MEFNVTTKNDKKDLNISMDMTDGKNRGQYARVFDESNCFWNERQECNLWFLIHQQNYANDKLRMVGYLFLNEVYELLGFPKTDFGNAIGWIYDEQNPIGDNYVDFGIYNLCTSNRSFNAKENSIILDFNVDGEILSKI